MVVQRSSTYDPARLRTRLGVAAGCVALLAVGACGGSIGPGGGGTAGAEPVRIGLLAPVTGPTAPEGNAMKQGFDLAIKDINARGGIFGKPVEVSFVDDRGDAATATQAAQRLIQQDRVNYLFGTVAGDTTTAVANVAGQAGVPMSQAILGTIDYCGPNYWPFGESETQLLTALVPTMIQQFGPKVALVGSDYVFPHRYHAVSRELVTKAGGTVVAEEYSPLGTSDWQPVVGKVASAQPNWVLSGVVGGDAISFVKQADQFGLLKGRGLTGISLDQYFYPALTDKIEGRLQAERYTDQLPGERNKRFVAEYRAAYHTQDPIPSVAANAYDGMEFIAEAFTRAGSKDAGAVSAQMGRLTFDGLAGPARFDPDNHIFHTPMYLTRIDKGGAYTVVKDLGVIDDKSPKNCR
jgi:ABC-type branched-subunit amino acid transport system substrate-binding protein